ncbi:MAG: hypothetical protein AAF677_18140, partial [Pseudomonadota bacterium]
MQKPRTPSIWRRLASPGTPAFLKVFPAWELFLCAGDRMMHLRLSPIGQIGLVGAVLAAIAFWPSGSSDGPSASAGDGVAIPGAAVAGMRAEQDTPDPQMAAAMAELAALREQLADIDSANGRDLAALQAQVEADRQRLRDLRERLASSSSRFDEALSDLTRSQNSLEAARARVTEQDEEIEALRAALTEAREAERLAAAQAAETAARQAARAAELAAAEAAASAEAAEAAEEATAEERDVVVAVAPTAPGSPSGFGGGASGLAAGGDLVTMAPLTLNSVAPDSFARPSAQIVPSTGAGGAAPLPRSVDGLGASAPATVAALGSAVAPQSVA